MKFNWDTLITALCVSCPLGALLFLTASCNQTVQGYPREPHYVVVIDGCQYLEFRAYTSFTYTHKGNCTNVWHFKTAESL